MPPISTYSMKRAILDVILSLITCGWWSIAQAYCRRKNI